MPKHPVRAAMLASAVTVAVAAGPVIGSPATAAPPSAGPPDSYVTQWDVTGSAAFTAAALSPAEGHLIFAYVAIAVYDSVMAVTESHAPFAVEANAPAGSSAEAAVAASAHRVLAHYLPAQVPTVIDPAYVTSLGTIPDGPAKSNGIAVGEQVANALIALRAGDGFRAPAAYTPPDPPVPGVWLPTAPTPAIGAYVPAMRPFTLKSADQFRPAGPPDLLSTEWATEFNEVKEIGSSTSTTRTAAQTTAARFWAQAPVQQARGSFRRFISDHGLDVVQAARFLAMVSVTYADAFIACFDAKYHFTFWRPVTAVRAGDTDGNPETAGDPSWSPILPATPNHPEYPSAHSCITPAAGLVAARFLGTARIDFVVPSLSVAIPDRTFATPHDLTSDVSNARVWGGIHFRSAVEDGADIARRTANWVLAHHFPDARAR